MVYPTITDNFNLATLNANFLELANRTVNGVSWGTNKNISITANPTQNLLLLLNTDLNTILNTGFYSTPGGNACANKPSGVDAFGLIVYKSSMGYTTQDLVEGNANPQKRWSRQYNGSTWSSWIEIYTTRLDGSYTPTASNLGTITTHTAMVKSGIGRYKLHAVSGTWTANTNYVITTLDNIYRPANNIEKGIVLRNGVQGYLYIGVDGLVQISPWASITNNTITIDETYVI